MEVKAKHKLLYQAKKGVVSFSLVLLGVAFEMVSKLSPELKEELKDWDEGAMLCLGVLPDGPKMTVRNEGGTLRYLGKGDHGAELAIFIKNMDYAFMMMTGLWGAVQGFAEHRAIVHGGIYQAMQANRAMAIVQKFLFPGFVLTRNFKQPPKFTGHDYYVKARVMATLMPVVTMNLTKE